LKNIEVIKQLKPDLPQVWLDKGKMEQVFVNILLNAIQAMPEGGKMYIRTYSRQVDSIGGNVGRRSSDQFKLEEMVVLVEIEDTGIGISKENLLRVFDPFFTTKSPGEGTGLGLAVVRNIIDMHKGLINIESTENKGTKVMITLKTAGG
jgi:signal transduction histidine kinase